MSTLQMVHCLRLNHMNFDLSVPGPSMHLATRIIRVLKEPGSHFRIKLTIVTVVSADMVESITALKKKRRCERPNVVSPWWNWRNGNDMKQWFPPALNFEKYIETSKWETSTPSDYWLLASFSKIFITWTYWPCRTQISTNSAWCPSLASLPPSSQSPEEISAICRTAERMVQ